MLTKLEAVNILLDAISVDAVSSLESDDPDAVSAERFLDRISKEVQEVGWHCNRAILVTYTPDVNGTIYLPINTLRADAVDRFVNVCVKELDGRLALWDLKNRTFEFDDEVELETVSWFEVDEVPFAMANYIAYEAAVQFQMSEFTSTTVDAALERKRQMAWQRFQDAEADADDANVILCSPSVGRIALRRNFFPSTTWRYNQR